MNPTFNEGLALHQQGQFAAAQAVYAQVLAEQPDHFDALHLTGAIALHHHQLAEALGWMDKALAINPHYATVYSNRGLALQRLGRLDEALASYDQALVLAPQDSSVLADAHYNRGIALQALQRLDEACASFIQAVALKPSLGSVYVGLGHALLEAGHAEDAIRLYDQAIAAQAADAQTHNNRGAALHSLDRWADALHSYTQALAMQPGYAEAYFNQGLALQQLERTDEALASFDQAIALRPQYELAYCNRGFSLQKMGRYDEALASYDQALALDPAAADAHYNRGCALHKLQRPNEALASYDQAIALDPDYKSAHANRGLALLELKRLDEAQASYDRAIALNPNDADAHWNKGLACLMQGHYAQGWPLYEWGWQNGSRGKKRVHAQPLWLGQEDLTGKTCLLYAEQGLGDVIQFCRYARQVKALGAKVLLEVPKSMLGLMQTLEGVDVLIESGVYVAQSDGVPAFDYQVPLGSLPLAFKTEVGTIPDAAGYLRVNDAKRAVWQERLGPKRKPRVGVVWSSASNFKGDATRSMGLKDFAQCLDFESYEVVCLQKVIKSEDQAAFDALGKMAFYGDALEDFADTAALASCMDVVVSTCTSVPHMTGALGIPTWVLLQYVPDWRWLLERRDSPWYSSVRLFRQSERMQWGPVLAQVRLDLRNVR